MSTIEVDATNACIPPSSPLVALFPPLPSTVRGEPCVLDGKCGRLNSDKGPMLLYGNGRCVVVRNIYPNNGNVDHEHRIHAFVYRGHNAQVTCAKFSPSGAYVASADVRGKLRVWSYDNEEHFCKLDFVGMNGPIRGVAWDGDSKRICVVGQVSSSSSSCVRVFQWDTGVTCGTLGRHQRNRVSSCDFRKSRPMRVVTGGTEDRTVNLNGGIPLDFMCKSQEGHTKGAIHALKYVGGASMEKGNGIVVSVGADKQVTYWDGKTLDLIRTEKNVHDGTIYSCDWSSDGKTLLTAGADGKVKLSDIDSGEVLKTWDVAGLQLKAIPDLEISNKVPFGGMQLGCAFVKGDLPLSVGVNGKIALMGDDDKTSFLEGHQYPIAALTLDEEAKQYYTGDSKGVICQWNVRNGTSTPLANIKAPRSDLLGPIHKGAITAMEWVSGTLLSVGWDDVIRLSDIDTGASYQEIKLSSQPNSMSKGRDLVVIVMVGGIALFQGKNIILERSDFSFEPKAVAVSPDDKIVCIAGTDKVIRVCEFLNGSLNEITSIAHHLKEIHSLSFSPDGSKLASADVRDVCVWDTSTWTPLISKNRWCFHTQKITSLAWSPNGEVLASAGLDECIYLWNLNKKMKRVTYLNCHRGGVTGMLWRNDSILSSVGQDSCLCEWDVSGDIKNTFG